MFVVAIGDRSATARTTSRRGAGLALALWVAGLAVPGAAADQTASLDQLSTTLADLKLSLSSMRRDLEAMRATPAEGALPAPEARCAAAPAELPGAGEAAAREVARLRSERATLEGRIAELEAAIRQARTSEVVADLARPAPASPIETAAAAELDPRPARGSVLKVAAPAQPPAAATADGSADLQVRAELALAQLKIAELEENLQSTRAGQAALEAELASLRLLTDAKIKHFMGWR